MSVFISTIRELLHKRWEGLASCSFNWVGVVKSKSMRAHVVLVSTVMSKVKRAAAVQLTSDNVDDQDSIQEEVRESNATARFPGVQRASCGVL